MFTSAQAPGLDWPLESALPWGTAGPPGPKHLAPPAPSTRAKCHNPCVFSRTEQFKENSAAPAFITVSQSREGTRYHISAQRIQECTDSLKVFQDSVFLVTYQSFGYEKQLRKDILKQILTLHFSRCSQLYPGLNQTFKTSRIYTASHWSLINCFC